MIWLLPEIKTKTIILVNIEIVSLLLIGIKRLSESIHELFFADFFFQKNLSTIQKCLDFRLSPYTKIKVPSFRK
jgi:hypothetical protein